MIEKTSPTRLKTRVKIIETSKNLFDEKGITNTTIMEIAKKTGITRKTVYDHFETKENLIGTILYDYFVELYLFEIDFDENNTGFMNLSKLFHTLFDRYYDRGYIMRFLVSYYREFPKKTKNEKRIFKELKEKIKFTIFGDIYTQGKKDGTIKCENPFEIGNVVLQYVVGIPMRYSLRSDAFFGSTTRVSKKKLHKLLDMILELYRQE